MNTRNKPCKCGSGKKYKHCCGLPIPPVVAMPYLTDESHEASVLDLHERRMRQEAERVRPSRMAAEPSAAPPATMTLKEVAAYLSLSKRTVSRRIEDDAFPSAVWVGGCQRFVKSEVDAYLARKMEDRNRKCA